MREKIYSILKGRLLLADNAAKNWRMLFFLSFLALIMISISHLAEKKVYEIAAKNKVLKEYRTRFVNGRSKLMKMKMESLIKQKLAPIGVFPSKEPPFKLIIKEK